MSRFWQAWFPSAARGKDDAAPGVYRDRPGLWVRNVAISLLLPVALLALCFVALPEHLLADPWVRVPLAAATPSLAIALQALLTARATRKYDANGQ